MAMKKVYLGVVEVAVAFVVVGSFFTFWHQPTSATGATSTAGKAITIEIPSGAGVPPTGWTSAQGPVVSPSFYSPDTILVVIGVNSTVTWVNQDTAPHTVTAKSIPSGTASFDSGTISQGGSFAYTFQEPGQYLYVCTFHPWMGGKVVVVGKSG